ncbi:MAG: hypothetical protein M3198_09010 [Actinomycetota bacterium]|nr:hypothetical protein [Actinomycetota bacterium]
MQSALSGALARAALVVFAALVALGLVLLFAPELANDLDRRSSGGDVEATGPGVTVTEAKRTAEETTEADRGSESDSTSREVGNEAGGRRGPGRKEGGKTKTTQVSESDESVSSTTTETTTTRTTPSAADVGPLERALAVPAVMVLLRCAAVAAIAGLAALPLLLASRRKDHGSNASAEEPPTPTDAVPAAKSDVPAVPPAKSDVPPKVPPAAKERPAPRAVNGSEAGASPSSGSGPRDKATAPDAPKAPITSPNGEPATTAVRLPVKPLVMRVDAEKAKARIIEGIPLLSEVFEARGEPTISNTLPDMRVRVQLTDTLTKEQPLPVSVLAEDPTLALATFRTEVEQRLRRLARDAVAQSADSTDEILRSLVDERLFEPQAAEGFRNLLRMSERALHGARVDPAMGAWVREEGVSLLLSLDLMLPS